MIKWGGPDTQGYLAIAIITIVSAIVFVLLLRPITMTDTVQGMLLPIIGILVGCLKDVFAYYFNSTSSSRAKDDTIKTMVAAADTSKVIDPLAKWQK